MSTSNKPSRQSVALPQHLARRVKAIAKSRKVSANRVIVELIEEGLESKDREKEHFFELAERLAASKNPHEQRQLKEELARLTFGE
jgi:metal-responsive CopG/Arc/MetJ family transcriptional regulator